MSAPPELPTWTEVDALEKEDRATAALEAVEQRLTFAREAGHSGETTRAMVRKVELLTALHRLEEAIHFLERDLATGGWPERPEGRAILDLTFARLIEGYASQQRMRLESRPELARPEGSSPGADAGPDTEPEPETKREDGEAGVVGDSGDGPLHVAAPLGADPELWTLEQLLDRAEAAYIDAWSLREALGAVPLSDVERYFELGTYPERIRGTLRDAVSYAWAQRLGDRTWWDVRDEIAADALSLPELLSGEGEAGRVEPTDTEAHSLSRFAAALRDLERWHDGGGRPEASLEAFLERARVLHAMGRQGPPVPLMRTAAADGGGDDESKPEDEPDEPPANPLDAIREQLEARAARVESLPWWSQAQATLAELAQSVGQPVRALRHAERGAEAFPESIGGAHCRSLIAQLTAPSLHVNAMRVDGPARRSLELIYGNVRSVRLRSFRLPLVEVVARWTGYTPLLRGKELEALLASEPTAEWTETLPEVEDLRQHRAFVTPKDDGSGLHVIEAAVLDDDGGVVLSRAVHLIRSDVVLTYRRLGPPEGALAPEGDPGAMPVYELRAVSGRTGEPLEGAKISLLRLDGRGERLARSVTTDAEGWAWLEGEGLDPRTGYGVVAEADGEWVWLEEQLRFRPERGGGESLTAAVYTDRSVYRPGERLHWKAVLVAPSEESERSRHDALPVPTPPALRGRTHGPAEHRTVAATDVVVRLLDPSGEEVSREAVTTNTFGTTSGSFELPEGRRTGVWRVEVISEDTPMAGADAEAAGRDAAVRGAARRPSSAIVRTRVDGLGSASVHVEAYRRPTLELTLEGPKEAPRADRPVTLEGEARYLFGQAVREGSVTWSARIAPRHIWRRGGPSHPGFGGELIATGSAELDDGRFELSFVPRLPEDGADAYRFVVRAELTESGGETASAERGFIVALRDVEASLELPGGFVPAGERASVTVTRSDWEGEPAPGEGRWRLGGLTPPDEVLLPAELPVELEPAPLPTGDVVEPRVTKGDLLRPRWAALPSLEEQLALWGPGATRAEGALVHGEDGTAELALPALDAGAYRLRYETRDGSGATVEVERTFVVGGGDDAGGSAGAGPEGAEDEGAAAGDAGASGRNPLPLPVVLLAQEPEVEVGELATVLVHSGLEGLPLTLEVRRGERLLSRHHFVGGGAPQLFELRIRPEDVGGLELSLWGVKDHQLLRATQTVAVPFEDKALDVRISRFRDRLEPGSAERWKLEIHGEGGRPLRPGEAELLAYMYDAALDAIAPHAPPNLASFHRQRPTTSWLRTTLGSQGAYGLVHPPSPPPAPQLAPPSLAGGVFHGWGRGAGGHRMMAFGRGADGSTPEASMAMADRSGLAKSESSAEGDAAEQAPPGGPRSNGPPPVELRRNLAPLAFWAPHVTPDRGGSVTLSFEVPEALTRWNVWLHALTRDLKVGRLHREVRTAKDLMVRPNLPRFLREGDDAVLRVTVHNDSEGGLEGELRLTVRDAAGRSLGPADGVVAERKPFELAAGATQALAFPVSVPRGLGPWVVEAVATARATSGSDAGTGSPSPPGAGSMTLSDGEARAIPVLPARTHLVESRFAVLRGNASKTLDFGEPASRPWRERGAEERTEGQAAPEGEDETLREEDLWVTVDGRMFEATLAALPSLVRAPHKTTEQSLDRFIGMGALSRLLDQYPAARREVEQLAADPGASGVATDWDDLDPNRRMALEETPWAALAREDSTALWALLRPEAVAEAREDALARLADAQTPEGGFPWWPGGRPSPLVTLQVLEGLAQATSLGVDVPAELTRRAFAYLSDEWSGTLHPLLEASSAADEGEAPCCIPQLVRLVWVASLLPEAAAAVSFGSSRTAGTAAGSTSGEADAEGYAEAPLGPKVRNRVLDHLLAHRAGMSPYLKAMLALTLHHEGRDGDGRQVLGALLEAARSEPEAGLFWQPEPRAWLWHNDTVAGHALALRAVLALRPDDERRHGLVQWLLVSKQLQDWGSPRATVSAIQALTSYMASESLLDARTTVSVEVAGQRTRLRFAPGAGTPQRTQLQPRASRDPRVAQPEGPPEVVVSQEGDGFALVTATRHLSTELALRPGDGELFSIRRRYFRIDREDGRRVPLASGDPVELGDEVEVWLSFRAAQPADYVHLRDPRPAGFEPSETRSGWASSDSGLWHYRAPASSGMELFVESLPAGEHTLRHRLRASTEGRFRVAPTSLQSMYAPEFGAHSAGDELRVSLQEPARD